MYKCISLIFALAVVVSVSAQDRFPGVGREATPAEIKAWDIDVRPDFTGLPKGSGSAKKGEDVWIAKCASCHGDFAESNETFPPIVGGTTRQDIDSGRVAALLKPEQGRTTLMKLSQISTLWDYINRAMPWNAPKTLSVEEVYAVTAYLLSLGYIVSDDFVLSDANIAEVQKRLPNRNGMTRAHGLWDKNGKPDVHNAACMKNCAVQEKIMSQLPGHARDAHGSLADQNRIVGPVRGVQTVKTAAAAPAAAVPAQSLANQSGCLACHAIATRLVGPSFSEIAAKYRSDSGAPARLVAKIRTGGSGAWGQVVMPPQPNLADDDAVSLVQWVLGGAK